MLFKTKTKAEAKDAVDFLRAESAEAGFYEKAAEEIAAGSRVEGVWVRALAENDMDEAKAAAAYMRMRVEIMKAEFVVETTVVEERAREAAVAAEKEITEADRRKAQMAKNFAAS